MTLCIHISSELVKLRISQFWNTWFQVDRDGNSGQASDVHAFVGAVAPQSLQMVATVRIP